MSQQKNIASINLDNITNFSNFYIKESTETIKLFSTKNLERFNFDSVQFYSNFFTRTLFSKSPEGVCYFFKVTNSNTHYFSLETNLLVGTVDFKENQLPKINIIQFGISASLHRTTYFNPKDLDIILNPDDIIEIVIDDFSGDSNPNINIDKEKIEFLRLEYMPENLNSLHSPGEFFYSTKISGRKPSLHLFFRAKRSYYEKILTYRTNEIIHLGDIAISFNKVNYNVKIFTDTSKYSFESFNNYVDVIKHAATALPYRYQTNFKITCTDDSEKNYLELPLLPDNSEWDLDFFSTTMVIRKANNCRVINNNSYERYHIDFFKGNSNEYIGVVSFSFGNLKCDFNIYYVCSGILKNKDFQISLSNVELKEIDVLCFDTLLITNNDELKDIFHNPQKITLKKEVTKFKLVLKNYIRGKKWLVFDLSKNLHVTSYFETEDETNIYLSVKKDILVTEPFLLLYVSDHSIITKKIPIKYFDDLQSS